MRRPGGPAPQRVARTGTGTRLDPWNMRVVVTGAAGKLGRHAVRELAGAHELRLVDRVAVAGHPTTVADLSRGSAGHRWLGRFRTSRPSWDRAFQGAQVVVHLAANSVAEAPWESVLRDNFQASWNVFEAAARHSVSKIVFASSCRWALGLDPDTHPDWSAIKLTPSTPTRPRTPYGLSKAWGELLGRMFVDTGKVRSVLAVRIGSFRELEPKELEVRSLWLGPEDWRSLLRRCVEAEVTGFHTLYGVSPGAGNVVDLMSTRKLLAWTPEEH